MARPRPSTTVIVDARPRGPAGPIAGVALLGRPMLAHLVELAARVGDGGPVVVHARADEREALSRLLGADEPAPRVAFATGPPPEGALVLRADRLYDPSRLRRAARRGRDAEAAAFWRLDSPDGLLGAEAELVRRRNYQPIGRYWSVGLAGLLVRVLAPTRVRPHALTVGSFLLMLLAAGLVGWGRLDATVRWGTAAALAAALVLDGADGRLARRQGTASPIGRWLDTTLDETGEMAFHAAISCSAFARDGWPGWLMLGMAFGMGKYLFTVSNDEWDRALGLRDRNAGLARVPLDAEPRPRSPTWWLRKLGHSDVRWHLWIVAAAAGRLEWALAAFAVYFPTRAVAGAARKVGRSWRGEPGSRP